MTVNGKSKLWMEFTVNADDYISCLVKYLWKFLFFVEKLDVGYEIEE